MPDLNNQPAPIHQTSHGRAVIILSVIILLTAGFLIWQWPRVSGFFGSLSTSKTEQTNQSTSTWQSNPVGDIVPIPNLYVATRDGIFYARYDSVQKEYQALANFADVKDVIKMNTTQDAVFIYRPESVERRLHDGTVIATWQRSSSSTYQVPTAQQVKSGSHRSDQVQTGVYDRGRIYVAANRSLVILDENLRELGNITPLERSDFYAYKAIDDILVVDDYALLVDDIASPLFVFSVDVQDPTKPKLVRTIGVGGVYGTVTNQWYDHQKSEWCWHRSTSSGYVGNAYTVFCASREFYSNSGATWPDGYYAGDVEGLRTREVGTEDVDSYETDQGQGFSFIRDLNRIDDWVLLQDQGSRDTYIAGLNSNLEIEAKIDVGDYLDQTKPFFYRYAGYIYLYTLEKLNVYEDDGTRLTGVFSQTIPQQEVPRTNGTAGTMPVPAWNNFAADPR